MNRVEKETDASIIVAKDNNVIRYRIDKACCDRMNLFLEQGNQKDWPFLDCLSSGRFAHLYGAYTEEVNFEFCPFCTEKIAVFVVDKV